MVVVVVVSMTMVMIVVMVAVVVGMIVWHGGNLADRRPD
jgi:hypothetical protein